MQYCKNCGRQLKDGMRFCDRCGQSVRKSQENSQAARHKEIRELQEERLNRKKRLAEKEERQRTVREKRRKSRGRRAVIYILAILLITAASVLVGYFYFSGRSGSTNDVTGGMSVPSATATPSAVQTETPVQSGEYAEITVGNVRCPYPAAFHSGSASGNVKMNLTDPLGGAKMIIAQEVTEGALTELAKGYLSQIGATSATEMKSNESESSYTVTAEVKGTVYHRKCVVRSKLAVYYDFEYSASSGSAPAYEKYIAEIDARFK